MDLRVRSAENDMPVPHMLQGPLFQRLHRLHSLGDTKVLFEVARLEKVREQILSSRDRLQTVALLGSFQDWSFGAGDEACSLHAIDNQKNDRFELAILMRRPPAGSPSARQGADLREPAHPAVAINLSSSLSGSEASSWAVGCGA